MSKYGILKEYHQTCSCCPSQWNALTEQNEFIYIRYRWGTLTIQMSASSGNLSDAINTGNMIFVKSIGNEYDGTLTTEELIQIINENDLFDI